MSYDCVCVCVSTVMLSRYNLSWFAERGEGKSQKTYYFDALMSEAGVAKDCDQYGINGIDSCLFVYMLRACEYSMPYTYVYIIYIYIYICVYKQ